MTTSTPVSTGATPALRFVDTHCHLDDESFDADLDDVLARAAQSGVSRWINVGFNPERWDAAIRLGQRYPGMAYMLGVHPGDADSWNDDVAALLALTIDMHPPVAIGEIGLDFFRGETNAERQVTAFEAQLDLAVGCDLPVAIHMRDAEQLMIDVLTRRNQNPRLLFHSFDGSDALVDWVNETGSMVGVGGLATRSKSANLRRRIARIPLDQVVLETDSPYLVPNGFKHRRNTPESIPLIAEVVASMYGLEVADVARITTANAARFFGQGDVS